VPLVAVCALVDPHEALCAISIPCHQEQLDLRVGEIRLRRFDPGRSLGALLLVEA
jgi:hypothetical protein